MNRDICEGKKPLLKTLRFFVKWTFLSSLIGLFVGVVGGVFGNGVAYVTRLWNARPELVFLMPVAGLMIVSLYRLAHEENNQGTDGILEAISSEKEVSFATGPLIFAATILSHSVSASAGREGAALQLGGSLGNTVSRAFHLKEAEKRIAVMCGMSACFAALFGTPLAAGAFVLEVAFVGTMEYAALVPSFFPHLSAQP